MEPNQSPKPATIVTQLDFSTVIRKIIDGKRVTKIEWGSEDAYGLLKDGLLMLHKAGEPADKLYKWIISEGDLIGIDWIVLPE